MNKDKIEYFANKLFEAQENKIAISPLTKEDPSLTLDDAYAIQLKNVERMVAAGDIISGKKIGLTSQGIQEQMGVNEPDYGHLYQSMLVADGKVKTSNLLQPKIEGELAFILEEDLAGGNVTYEDVIKATKYVVAAFEVVASRVKDWNIKLVDTVADNASSGCYILGKTKFAPQDIDLLDIEMKLYKNDELVATGNSLAVLENPAKAVAWLANRMWAYGVTLQKGEIILSGAFSKAPEAAKGDVFVAEFSHFGRLKAEFI